ncbi:uncharacterized protein LOC132631207 [Lycium barbarum]|uniref:uncharacterized protein LOC132631207 n=1 Tax=Lycium barbarum TaxID=112863 RepID=UPI00293EE99A|nr:uncharacterized protein LOC132631207 [Lycium barbarum]
MISALSWNIRGINSNGAFDKFKHLKRQHNLCFIAIQEPFVNNSKIDRYKRGLRTHFAFANCSNKIWIFCDEFLECNIISDTEQQVSGTIKNNDDTITITIVYAKCDANLRMDLWDDIKNIATNCHNPWMVIGDFNCILDSDEKEGGNFYNTFERQRIWKRLDRGLSNQQWVQRFNDTSITHLVRTRSDHAPLLVSIASTSNTNTKYFRFLNFWVEEPGFQEVVKQAWQIPADGSPMWKFHLKLKNTYKQLS